jgi:redox-sensitive bicupin YhaK (pirin superfamily)
MERESRQTHREKEITLISVKGELRHQDSIANAQHIKATGCGST